MFPDEKLRRKTQSQPASKSKCIQTHCEDPANDLTALNEEYVHIYIHIFTFKH